MNAILIASLDITWPSGIALHDVESVAWPTRFLVPPCVGDVVQSTVLTQTRDTVPGPCGTVTSWRHGEVGLHVAVSVATWRASS